jgi:hypothetical protein
MRIPQINTVIEFELTENVILIIAGALRKYQEVNNAKVQILNVPHSVPPDAPRIVLITQNALIRISLTRFEINSKIPNHIINNFDSAVIFTKSIIKNVIETLMVPELKYTWLGVVNILEYSVVDHGGTALKVSEKFFDKLINIDRNNKDLASFEIKFGFNEGCFFRNYSISGFETRDIKLEFLNGIKGIQVVDLEKSGRIIDKGLRIVLDINNKPGNKSLNALSDLDTIFEEVNSKYRNLFVDLNIKDMI